MHRSRTILLALAGTVIGATLALTTGCSCSVTGDGGSKAVDVDMGGKVVKADYLKFEPVSLSGTSLVIRNTASEGTLAIGGGTPILNGDGSQAATVRYPVTIDAGDEGRLTLSAPLTTGITYYLGEPQGGGKPTIRQLFIAPENLGGGGGFNVPDVPDVDEADLGE